MVLHFNLAAKILSTKCFSSYLAAKNLALNAGSESDVESATLLAYKGVLALASRDR